MLIQMPRGSPDRPGSQNAENGSAFEVGLRRDLASAPVISYDAMLGGWPKRAIDLAVILLSSPLWAPALAFAVLWAKSRGPSPVIQARECIGYGGRPFQRYTLRLTQPSAKIEQLRAPPQELPADDPGSPEAEQASKMERALAQLPLLINVVRGDMALVGPLPLSAEQLEPMKTAKRYYLSARPGIVGVGAAADAQREAAEHFKVYSLCWSLAADAVILWEAIAPRRQRAAPEESSADDQGGAGA